MSLSLVIVNWNSKVFLRKCIHSVQKMSPQLLNQIVVVDSGSFDGCARILAEEFPKVQFVQSFDNLGFGESNNLGFKYVTGEYLLLLNPDTEVKPNAVEVLLEALQKHPTAGLVAPRLINTDGSLQTSCVQALPTPLNQALDADFFRRIFPKSRLWGTWDAFSSTEPVKVEAVSGACMLLRSELFRKAGGFNPEFFMYAEDMDLCAKIRRLGLDVYHVPGAKVLHHGGGSSSGSSGKLNTIMMREALETYMRINHGNGTAIVYRILQGISALFRIGLLIPLTLKDSRKVSIRGSVWKWWYVLTWALGVN
jgi:GT2 family glycosyltransferase